VLPEAIDLWLEGVSARAANVASRYNVDPRIFVLLYLGSIPPYLASIAWLVKRKRRGGAILVPALSTIIFFALPAFYILAFGRNLPIWVQPLVLAVLVAGAISIRRKLRSELRSSSR
jgi:hypothetical protein